MGSAFQICNQVDTVKSKIEQDLQQPNDEKHYAITNTQETDHTFLNEIQDLRNNQEFSEILANKVIMKHREKDQYYLGAWAGGFKKGKGVSYVKDNYIYHGDFDKVPHGHGVLKLYQQNIVIEGQIKEGTPEGQCKIKDLNGVYTFEGVINEKKVPNNGTFHITNSIHNEKSYAILLDDYPNNKAKINFNDGTRYLGEINFATLLPEGQGEASYQNGTKYNGSWEDGLYHGEGHFTWHDGSNYIGSYVKGIKSGKGNYEYVSKKMYRGQWAKGKQEGYGEVWLRSGEVIKRGFWKNGEYVGEHQEVEL